MNIWFVFVSKNYVKHSNNKIYLWSTEKQMKYKSNILLQTM